MAHLHKLIVSVFFLQILLLLLVLDFTNAHCLKLGFYNQTCPDAESIISKITHRYVSEAPTLAASLMRLHFHDCFVRGCDGSVLLNSTKNNQAEKDSIPSKNLRGFNVIDAAKSALETKCPGVVSCADIVALVARDAISLINGPVWEVPTGRRDGRVSMGSEALKFMPPPFGNITLLKSKFKVKGLSPKDLAVLLGAHSVGVSHCTSFTQRLYNITGKDFGTDPKLDPNYAAHLKRECKPGDQTTLVEMDPGSFKTFDNHYYVNVAKRRGLFQSDAALLDDKDTRAYVNQQVKTHGSTFFKDFAASIQKVGRLGVLTGSAGEIRRHCALIN